MEKLNVETPYHSNPTPEEIAGRMHDTQLKVNELIEANAKLNEDLGVAMEKIASVDKECGALKDALTRAEKALVRAINNLDHHVHGPDGKAAVPLA